MNLKDHNKFNSDQLDGKHASNSANNVPVLDSSGKLPIAQIPTGTSSSSVATGNHTHNYAGSSSAGGSATSAEKLSADRKISLTGDATGSVTFNGSTNASIATTLASSGVTAGSYGPSANASPAHSGTFSVPYFTVDAKGRVTAASTKTITLPADNNTTYSTGTTSVAGLTKLYTGTGTATDGTMTQAAITTALNGKANSSHGTHVPTVQTANNATFLRNDNTWQKVTPANIGAAATSHGTHVTWATTAPLANGTAAVGTVARVAREDHVHPLQTSVSGNAGTATKLATARTISLSGDVTGSASFDGSANISITTKSSGASLSLTTKTVSTVTTPGSDFVIEQSENGFNTNGTTQFNSSYTHTDTYIPFSGNENATMTWGKISGYVRYCFYDENKVFLNSTSPQSPLTSETVSTIKSYNSSAVYFRMSINKTVTFGIEGGITLPDTIDSTLQLGTEPRQYAEIPSSDTLTVTLPIVSDYIEIHFIMKPENDVTVIFPTCRWETVPPIKAGTVYEIIFTYVNSTIGWLAGYIGYKGVNVING